MAIDAQNLTASVLFKPIAPMAMSETQAPRLNWSPVYVSELLADAPLSRRSRWQSGKPTGISIPVQWHGILIANRRFLLVLTPLTDVLTVYCDLRARNQHWSANPDPSANTQVHLQLSSCSKSRERRRSGLLIVELQPVWEFSGRAELDSGRN